MIEDNQAILNLSESENQHDSVTHNVDEDQNEDRKSAKLKKLEYKKDESK